jgi:hypothetical protein
LEGEADKSGGTAAREDGKPLAELYEHHVYRRKEYTESVQHAFWFCQFLVSDVLPVPGSSPVPCRELRFDGHEHFNAEVRRGGFGDDSICSIDGSMSLANFRSWLRALLNLLPQVGASRERTRRGHVRVPPFDGAGVPQLGYTSSSASS